MKKTCIGCSIYRGRHVGLWNDKQKGAVRPDNSAAARKAGDSEWVSSFDAFVQSVSGTECIELTWDM